jgi:phenylacetate-CoA ligase
MTVAITNAEPVFEYQRKMISKAFRCPVRETYGMAEIVASASECHKNQLHLWPEVGWIEVFENGQAVKNGTSGDLVCTGLFNADMPLIRYRVGDRGSLRATIEGLWLWTWVARVSRPRRSDRRSIVIL